MKNQSLNSQKGVSLYIAFMIMMSLLAIAFGISAILFSQMKMIRGIGDSVIAFYAADTGIEKTLFFDNKKIPDGGTRGLCDICNQCPGTECRDWTVTGGDCDPISCTDCTCGFYTTFDGKRYNIKATVLTTGGPSTTTITTIRSIGIYKETRRAIQVER